MIWLREMFKSGSCTDTRARDENTRDDRDIHISEPCPAKRRKQENKTWSSECSVAKAIIISATTTTTAIPYSVCFEGHMTWFQCTVQLCSALFPLSHPLHNVTVALLGLALPSHLSLLHTFLLFFFVFVSLSTKPLLLTILLFMIILSFFSLFLAPQPQFLFSLSLRSLPAATGDAALD